MTNESVVEEQVGRKTFTGRTKLDTDGRVAVVTRDAGTEIRVGAAAKAGTWTPQDLFLATLEACLMLTFMALARRCGVGVLEYESTSTGEVEPESFASRFTCVEIRPTILVQDDSAVGTARTLIARAHETCKIANSVRCEVLVYPVVKSALHPR